MILASNILQYIQSSLFLPILSLNTEKFSINLYFLTYVFIAFHSSRQRLPLSDSFSAFKASQISGMTFPLTKTFLGGSP